jgi:transposase
MSFKRAPYPHEFRRQLVELVRSGRAPEELAREFEPSAQSIRNWVAAADLAEGRRGGIPSEQEREERQRLRRENRRLRQEREILAKAAAWFARETGAMPDGSSRS